MKRYTADEYQDIVQQTFPHFSVVEGYVNLNTPVVMECSRCGGKFKRIAQANRSSECPVCFTVYISIYKSAPGFVEAVQGLADIRDLGKGNMDYHLTSKDVPIVKLAKKYGKLGRWGGLLHETKKHDTGIAGVVAKAIKKFADKI